LSLEISGADESVVDRGEVTMPRSLGRHLIESIP
jgi:hypothetical protein